MSFTSAQTIVGDIREGNQMSFSLIATQSPRATLSLIFQVKVALIP